MSSMQRHPLPVILGRPALHLLLALAFAVAFLWPIFALTRPAETFHLLYASWIVSLAAFFVVSRGAAIDSPDMLNEAEDGAEGGTADSTRETF